MRIRGSSDVLYRAIGGECRQCGPAQPRILGGLEHAPQVLARAIVQANLRQCLGADDGALGIGAAGAVEEGVGKQGALSGPLWIGIVLERARGLQDNALEHGELGLRLHAASDQLDEIAGAHSAGASHLPGGRPAQGAGHGIGKLIDVIQQELQGTRVQLDEAVSQVIVIR